MKISSINPAMSPTAQSQEIDAIAQFEAELQRVQGRATQEAAEPVPAPISEAALQPSIPSQPRTMQSVEHELFTHAMSREDTSAADWAAAYGDGNWDHLRTPAARP
jgi:hypothetical protein